MSNAAREMSGMKQRALKKVQDEQRLNGSKDGLPETTLQHVEAARRDLLDAITKAEGAAWPMADDRLMHGNPHHVEAERRSRMIHLEVQQAKYREVVDRFETLRRIEDGKTADLRAEEQTQLARVQANAAEAQVQIAKNSARAAWFAGLAAAAAIVIPLIQSCHH